MKRWSVLAVNAPFECLGALASVLTPSCVADAVTPSGKSMYCDVECADGSDPEDRLFPDMGGLWCKPFGYEGCRLCMFDCEDYDGDYCVPCPDGVKDFCDA